VKTFKSVVVVGTGKVVPPVAAAFASAGDRVFVAAATPDPQPKLWAAPATPPTPFAEQ